jgi:hypothetical protein
MKAIEPSVAVDPQERADYEAIMRQWLEGVPADPEVLRRVEERSRLASEEVRRLHGDIDVDALLREVRSEP